MATLFANGRIFQSTEDDAVFRSCMLVRDGLVVHVGEPDDEAMQAAKARGTPIRDLAGRTVLPGFVDGHMHLLMLGQSLQKVPLEGCADLNDIRAAIREYAAAHQAAPRILCRNWMFSMTGPGLVTAGLLDDLDPRPIYVDSKDLHATWCNTAALKEMGLWDDYDRKLSGGTIHRNPSTGRPTGLLSEAGVFDLVWPHLAQVASVAERASAVAAAVDAYVASGYTGVVDMALDEGGLEAILRYLDDQKKDGKPVPLRIAAYWLVRPRTTTAEHLEQVDRAVELRTQYDGSAHSPYGSTLRIVGVKLICDGIVDACTAALAEPYGDPTRTVADMLWPAEQAAPVLERAAAAGLQAALHAIGDATITVAVNAIEQAGPALKALRPRIEHLELASERDAARLGPLGITASIQPVHADPAILRAWPTLLGPDPATAAHRCGRAFAYREFADGGAPLALGTDAPTAPRDPLANAYVATTRRSAREPLTKDLAPVNPHFALTLCEAVTAATRGAAYSCFAEGWAGSLSPGKSADFVVVDMAWDAEQLLAARVAETWFAGRRAHPPVEDTAEE